MATIAQITAQLPSQVTVSVVDGFYVIEYRSTQTQPNGLPRFSAGITHKDNLTTLESLLSTILATGEYNVIQRKFTWQ